MGILPDLYPSRVDDEPSIVARRDPVVHAEAAAGELPIGDDDLAAYARDGFLVLEGFFDAAEAARGHAALEAEWRAHARSDAPEIVREPGGDEIRSIFAIHRRNAAFDRLVRDPRLLAIARRLLGGDVYVHQSRINFKPGFVGKEFYWHSDFETWHTEDGMPRMRALSCSIALTDNRAVNGPLMLIPGSHRYYVTCVGETPENHFKDSLRRQEIGVPDGRSLAWLAERGGGIAAPVGPAGTVVLFECNTMHGSNSNITPYPRSNVFFVYNSVGNALVAPFAGTRPRPEFIASRDFTALAPA